MVCKKIHQRTVDNYIKAYEVRDWIHKCDELIKAYTEIRKKILDEAGLTLHDFRYYSYGRLDERGFNQADIDYIKYKNKYCQH